MSVGGVSLLWIKRALLVLLAALLTLVGLLAVLLLVISNVREINEWPVPPLTEQDYEWQPLFDGKTLSGWRRYGHPEPGPAWSVVDGMIMVAPFSWHPSRLLNAGALITEKQYTNFELELEWKVAPGANSGIHFGVRESNAFWAAFETGAEIQVLDDDRHADGASPLTSAGSLYGMYPAPRGVVKPAGEFNAVRLRVVDRVVTTWLNEVEVSQFEIDSEDWQARMPTSKFLDFEHYAKYRTGHIGLQDHGNQVWFRNLRIRALGGRDKISAKAD